MIELLRGGSALGQIFDGLVAATVADRYPLESMLNVIRDLLRAGVQPRQRLVAFGEQVREKLPEAMKGAPLEL